MSVTAIRYWPDMVLRSPASEVTEFGSDLAALVGLMGDVMYERGGVGLAANQIGVSKRLFVYDCGEGGGRNLRVVVNPILGERTGEQYTEEGCLSLPGKWWSLPRAERVCFYGVDELGSPISGAVEGLEARIFQHEVDHLDGITLYQRITKQERLVALGLVEGTADVAEA